MTKSGILLVCVVVLAAKISILAGSFEVLSPGNNINLTVSYDKATGTLSYAVTSDHTVVLAKSPLGITTDKADFTSGLQLVKAMETKIDEKYTLPQGKVSTYHNTANELTLLLKKGDETVAVVFRAYDEGVAFRYAIPGSGKLEISREASGFNVAGNPDYWGQPHPNPYGYEGDLRKLGNDNAISFALLCELKESKHWVLLAQAATYGTYCIPHLKREGGDPNLLTLVFPNDQKEAIKTTLPFESPWRVAVISPHDLSTIVEQTLFENLNPATEPELQNADWIKPGRASWDWFAGDKGNWKGWIDFIHEMGWEYHLVDDGWQGYITDPVAVRKYAESKGCGLMAWQSTPSMGTPEKIETVLKKYSEMGLKGVKVDFFDRLPNGRTGDDYEDTQMGIQVRDSISRLAATYRIQIVFHGCAIPTGERRRWPHLLGTEAVKGQEGHPSPEHENCIAYIRNPLGPVDYSPTWFGDQNKTDAYQLATSVIFESGLLIFADLHADYLNHPSKEFLKLIPATWDAVRFVEGRPNTHTIIARRKGERWFVGGISSHRRTVDLSFEFLEQGVMYSATIFKDQESGLKTTVETTEVCRGNAIQLRTLDRGGFVILLEPKEESTDQEPLHSLHKPLTLR